MFIEDVRNKEQDTVADDSKDGGEKSIEENARAENEVAKPSTTVLNIHAFFYKKR